MNAITRPVDDRNNDRDRRSRASRLATFTTGCVVVLCVIACILTLLLPGDSLVIDLVYQRF